MRMFMDVGFEAATLEAIAAGAGIAPRTFFHYFPSKEALLFAYEDKAESGFRRALSDISGDTSPLDAVRIAMLAMVAEFASEEARALDQLLQSTEALRARKQANYGREEQRMVQALREKWPDPKLGLRLSLAAMMGMGAMRIASDAWGAANGSRSLQSYLEEAFAELGATMSAVPRRARQNSPKD